MADDALLDKIHALSDLELAVLLCLISREHCLVSTAPDAIDDLLQELQLVWNFRNVPVLCLSPVAHTQVYR